MSLLKLGNRLARTKKYREAIEIYKLACLTKGSPLSIYEQNIDYCVRLEQRRAGLEADVVHHKISAVVLTTIKARVSSARKVIESLHSQSLRPEKIILYVSSEPYLLDAGITKKDLADEGLFDFPLLEIRWVHNSGPFRKIVPYVQQCLTENRLDDIFVTADDDTLYPDYFLEKLLEVHRAVGGVVAFRGRKFDLDGAVIGSYSKWDMGTSSGSLFNVPTGKDGVLYRVRYFERDFVDIHNAVRLAPTADDLWIKWHTTLSGINSTIINPEACLSDYKSFPLVDYSKEVRQVSLYSAHNSGPGGAKNDKTVLALESEFKQIYGFSLGEILGAMVSYR